MLEPNSEVYDAVKGLRVVRNFEDRQLSNEHLQAILDAGRWTGSSKNRQSWAIVVVQDREQLDRLAECGDFTTPLRNAPTTLVPVRLPDGYDWDMGRLSQNIMLAAAALGVGSCPVTFHREDDAKSVLGVPGDHGARFGITLGYPDPDAEQAGRARSPLSGRKPLDDMIRRDRFDV
ncbi:MAG: nitroreductase family protein [Acidimicrobiia bacterium]|nr:nitroreductase family protein [Acidimicrobiia bacterium]